MPNRLLSTLLFLSSYSPVFLLLSLRAYDRACAVFVLSLGLLVLSLGGAAVFLAVARRRTAQEITVISVETRDADLAGYLVGYLLPFLGVFATSWVDVLAFGLFIVFVGIVYVNSRMIYVNPVLALFGYHLFQVRVTTDNQKKRAADDIVPQFLVTRQFWIRRNDSLTVRRVTNDALFSFPGDATNAAQRKD